MKAQGKKPEKKKKKEKKKDKKKDKKKSKKRKKKALGGPEDAGRSSVCLDVQVLGAPSL